MMTINVNNKALKIKQDSNILQLLQAIESPQEGVAVAVNNAVVLKHLWPTKTLSEHDSILIIQATQGG